MGSSSDVVNSVVRPVAAVLTMGQSEVGKRVVEGKPLVGQSITDPTGAKKAAKDAAKLANQQGADEANRQAALDEQAKKDKDNRRKIALAQIGRVSARDLLSSPTARSTILTSPLGLSDTGTLSTKTLLGV